MSTVYKVPLVLNPQPEGGFTVTCPVLPELITEGDSLEEALDHVQDAIKCVIELYEDQGKPLPHNLQQDVNTESIWFEHLLAS